MWLPRSIAAVSVAGLLITVPVVDLAHAGTPHPVSGDDHAVALARGGTVAAARAGVPATPGTTVKDVRVGQGSLIGVTLDAGTGAAGVRVRVQDDDGRWGAWTSLDVDGGPDAGTAEARSATVATDPLWIGSGDGDRHVQVELPRSDTADASLAVVDPGSSGADASVARRGPAATASAAVVGAPFIHSRRDWGADESLRTCAPTYAATTRAAVLHHTAGTNDYTRADVPSVIRGIYRYHTQTHGWCDIGYNVLVDRFGGLWEGRAGGLDRAVLGAHTGGFNEGVFGVSMIGDYQALTPSDATLESVARVMAWKLGGNYRDPRSTVALTSVGGGTSKYAPGTQVTLPRIFAHRDVGSTTCPGDDAYARLGALRDRVAELVGSPSGVLYDAWQARGGASGPLGQPSTTVDPTPTTPGSYQVFERGSLYWSPASGAHSVQGAVRDAWARMGWEAGVLGYPVTDERSTPAGSGRYNRFQGGSVYWSPATGAHEVHGAIGDEWSALARESGVLGYPSTDELPTPDGHGRFNHFQGGSVYYSRATGAHEVHGAIGEAWAAQGWETGALGYPTSDEHAVDGDPTARASDFTGGTITWSPSQGTTVTLD